jgi:hypothetical protein
LNVMAEQDVGGRPKCSSAACPCTQRYRHTAKHNPVTKTEGSVERRSTIAEQGKHQVAAAAITKVIYDAATNDRPARSMVVSANP